MKPFIKAFGEKAWRSVLTIWTHPTIKDSNDKEVLNPKISWPFEDDKLESYNSKALHAIFN